MTVRLFISNLVYTVTSEELKKLFSTVGPISYLYLPTDRATGKQRGFAFLDFNERAHAEEAVRRFNNQMFMGRPLAVSEARAQAPDQRAGTTGRAPGLPHKPSAKQQAANPAMLKKEGSTTFDTGDAPRRRRTKPKGRSQSERAPKAPMREVVKGQFFGSDDDDDFSGDDSGDENFASRVKDFEEEEK